MLHVLSPFVQDAVKFHSVHMHFDLEPNIVSSLTDAGSVWAITPRW